MAQMVGSGAPCKSDCVIHGRHFGRRRLRLERRQSQRSLSSKRKDSKTKPTNKSDIDGESRRELVQKVLDKYHSYLFHTCTQQTFPKESYLKFVTLIELEDDSDDEKTDVEHDEKEDALNLDQVHPDLPVYLFGTNLFYHDASVKTSRKQEIELIVEPVYDNLKDELLNNEHYALELDEYEAMVEEAQVYQQTYEAKQVTARSCGLSLDIKTGSVITVQHLMTLIMYCDDETIQHVFTKNCRKSSPGESLESLLKKNAQIAIWCRLLRECVLIFGRSLAADEKVYRGINGMFALSQIQAALWSPTSTTTNVCVANSFINDRKKGMIIRLFNDRGRGAMHFDCKWLSNFLEEKEKLFHGGVLIIDNVRLTNNELTPYGDSVHIYLQAMHLMQLIVRGRPFAHKQVFVEPVQDALQLLIELYLTNSTAPDSVPAYVLECFKSCVQTLLINDISKSLAYPVCILQSHWRQLKPQLLEYFVHFVSPTRASKGLFLRVVEAIKEKRHGRDILLVNLSEDSLVLTQSMLDAMFKAERPSTHTEPASSVIHTIKVLYFEQAQSIPFSLTYDVNRNNILIVVPLKLEDSSYQFAHTLAGYLYIMDGPVTIVQLELEINGNKEGFGEWLYSRDMDLELWKTCQQVTIHFALGCHGINYTGTAPVVSPFLKAKINNQNKDAQSMAPSLPAVHQLKGQGNAHFKNNQYMKALSCYDHALSMLSAMLSAGMLTDPVVIDPIWLACANNKALMNMKLSDFAGCVSTCDHILKWDNRNKKAFWRKATALTIQQKWLQARSVCEDYLKLDPRDRDLAELRQKIIVHQNSQAVSNKISSS